MKPKKPSKANIARLQQLVVDFVLAHGGRWYKLDDEVLGLVLPTAVGELYVRPVDDWIACRWADVDRACEHFNVHFIGIHRLNPYSGKWNFGCGGRLPPEDVFEAWRLEVEPLLVKGG
jgi:hypothetical protein